MTKNKLKRIFAFFMAINIFFQVVSPTVAMALTSGPSQPEMASFEPVGTTEMVDVFSGDFNYNIPLLTVPGPNGGYPINLAYHGGIGMEDESSWVGLGWNINPGNISRSMRGLPDDFNGDFVKREMNMKPNINVDFSFGYPTQQTEFFGLQSQQNMKAGLVWNNYKGIGFNGNFGGLIPKSRSENRILNQGFRPNINSEYNSLAGETSLNPSFSFQGQYEKLTFTFAGGAKISSHSGLKDLNFSVNASKLVRGKGYTDETGDQLEMKNKTKFAASASFASSGFVPTTLLPQTGISVGAMFSLGFSVNGVYKKFNINANYTKTFNVENIKDFQSYGYLYSQNVKGVSGDLNNSKLMDFNREKNVALSKDVPSMPAPIYTHDVFMASGQGTGGSFRAFRNDISILKDPDIIGKTHGNNYGLELGLGSTSLHLGLNYSFNYSRSFSGSWNDVGLYQDVYNKLFVNSNIYFKSPSDVCASLDDEPGMETSLNHFPITRTTNLYDLNDNISSDDINPLVDFKISNNGLINQSNYSTKRARSQLMSYKTVKEINDIPDYKQAWVDNAILNYNSSYDNGLKNHQIGEMSITNPDGNRYIYALPAVNKTQKESVFSVVNNSGTINHFGNRITDYDPTDNSLNNNKLEDNFYSATTLPAYAHNFLLTAIVAPDYVDLTGDGPTNDDFGYWVKFKYEKTSDNYKWRAPFNGANLLEGYMSTDIDDKAGLTYGEKEIWFLNTIETKTHIAKFILGNRKDGHGAAAENVNQASTAVIDNTTNGTLKKIDKIALYSKQDLITPLKEVNFTYNYKLCKNVLNNEDYASGSSLDNGKLTLEKISFSYLGNAKGSLSPYIFKYGENDLDQNPSYNPSQYNRWGNYQPNKYMVDNTIYPYVFQKDDYDEDGNVGSSDNDKEIRDNHASAWNLREIILPSGGSIKVDYEADDYSIVHDKVPMEMLKIIGFGPDSTGIAQAPREYNMTANNSYVYFELDNQTMTTPDVLKMVNGIDDMYFNVYMDLKRDGIQGVPKKDYVDGYATIDKEDPNYCGVYTRPNGENLGFVKLEPISIRDQQNGSTGLKTHPFKKAGWQYLKLERTDLLFPASNVNSSNGAIPFMKQVANATIGYYTTNYQLLMGYYNYCYTAGWCNTMNVNDGKPSFIRLNCHDGKKIGGGYRVKKVAIKDTWQETNTTTEVESEYGQEYEYTLSDGTSSGVATYEPLIGGEEIPYRKPIRYSSQYFILKNRNLYLEEPVGESYYPSPSVGYSRVIVKNIEKKDSNNAPITKTKDGKTVYEFYTTKDFPFSINRTNLDDDSRKKFKLKIPIPFVGSVSFNDYGYSQGMQVNTNDMHGKLKSMATYQANADLNNANTLPVSKVDYIYNTVTAYSPAGSNQLNSHFNCLFDDGIVKNAEMGITHETFVDMKQNSDVLFNLGFQANAEIIFVPPAFIPGIPSATFDYAESMFKSVVKMGVNSQTGVLMETRTFNEGSTVTSKNILFDANSGKPLLTTITNDFDKPIYKYEYSAAWAYKQLGNAYKNDRERFAFVPFATAPYVTFSGASNVLCEGDEVLVTTNAGTKLKCWVTNIIPQDAFQLKKEDGTPINTSGNGLIIKSGFKNQQSVSNGFIVSLTNPVTDKVCYFFDGVPQTTGPNIGGYNNGPKVIGDPFSVIDCSNPSITNLFKVTNVTVNSSGQIAIAISKFGSSEGCKIQLIFNNGIININNWYNFAMKKSGNTIYATDGTNTVIGSLDDGCGIIECLDGVLQASASQFKPKWDYDYLDIGNPAVKYNGTNLPTPIASANNSTANPYRLGTDGIWRMEKSWAYQTERKQNSNIADPKTTQIQGDGTFQNFVLFDWSNAAANKNWTNVNTVTKYSPYGFELENKNAIDILSSAIYGYNNSTQTAITANASYYETGFDGFEDYNGSSIAATTNGHINLIPNSGNIIFSSIAHTGEKSIEIGAGKTLSMAGSNASTNYYFKPVLDKQYFVSAWFKTANGKPNLAIQNALAGSVNVTYGEVIIEGWQKVEASFICTSALNPIIQFSNSNASALSYLDDVRIQPFKSTMKTFVYNSKTLWLMAELDNQNYATFYNYDNEGTLTQVKKETVNGVQTLKTTRSNIKR